MNVLRRWVDCSSTVEEASSVLSPTPASNHFGKIFFGSFSAFLRIFYPVRPVQSISCCFLRRRPRFLHRHRRCCRRNDFAPVSPSRRPPTDSSWRWTSLRTSSSPALYPNWGPNWSCCSLSSWSWSIAPKAPLTHSRLLLRLGLRRDRRRRLLPRALFRTDLGLGPGDSWCDS